MAQNDGVQRGTSLPLPPPAEERKLKHRRRKSGRWGMFVEKRGDLSVSTGGWDRRVNY